MSHERAEGSVDLSIVIVNWNTLPLLRSCLESVLQENESLSMETLVVDNASTDGSADMVSHDFPWVRLIRNSENVGFARANNQAILDSTGRYVFLLNSDTQVKEGAIRTLVQFMDKHPETGAVGPKIIHPQGRLRVLSCGYQPTLRTVFYHYFFLSRLFPNRRAFRGLNLIGGRDDACALPVEWLSGAALMVRRQTVEQVGLLDERWFMYAEDMEWCDRIGKAGWTIFHVPDATVAHQFGASGHADERVSTMWVESLHKYYAAMPTSSRFRLALFDLVLTIGFLFRASIYSVSRLITRQKQLWRIEARRFLRYAGKSARLLVDTCLNRSPAPLSADQVN